MLAPSTVPVAPYPARFKEGQHCGPLLPLPGRRCKSKRNGLLAIAIAAASAVIPPLLALLAAKASQEGSRAP
jgi:hypothetical protein